MLRAHAHQHAAVLKTALPMHAYREAAAQLATLILTAQMAILEQGTPALTANALIKKCLSAAIVESILESSAKAILTAEQEGFAAAASAGQVLTAATPIQTLESSATLVRL
jgi:hypothetical protein